MSEEMEEQKQDETKNNKAAWYFHGGSLLVAFLIVGPFMLPLVWVHPRYSSSKKVFLSVLILVISAVLLKVTMRSWESISDYYGLLGGNY